MRVEGGQHPQVLGRAGGRRDAAGLQHHAHPGPQPRRVPARVQPEHPDRAVIGPPVALADLDGGGLPGAVRPEDGRDRAPVGLQREPVHRGDPAVALHQVADLDGGTGAHARESRGCRAAGPSACPPAPASAVRAGRPEQRLEQPRVVAGLRVPLHGEQERLAGRPGVPGRPAGAELGGLDRAVVGPRGRDQPVAEPVDGLMVRGRHGEPQLTAGGGRAEQRAEPAVRGDPHRVGAEGARGGPVVVIGHEVRQVLMQSPPAGDVKNLKSAADGQDRHPAAGGRGQQGELGRVTARLEGAGARVRRGAVGRRVEVRAAGQHQRIQPGHRVRDAGHRRQQHRHRAGRRHLADVVHREQGGGAVHPPAPAGRLRVAAQADDRPPARGAVPGGRAHSASSDVRAARQEKPHRPLGRAWWPALAGRYRTALTGGSRRRRRSRRPPGTWTR